MAKLTHLDENGSANMVDVTDKAVTSRTAAAVGTITMNREAYQALRDNTLAKGDALSAARIAAIMGAKQTSALIPLCHPLMLTKISAEFTLDDENCAVTCTCTAKLAGKTGVEMEALTGVSVALLTIYDMCKALDKAMVIGNIHLMEKTGGKSGHYLAAGTQKGS